MSLQHAAKHLAAHGRGKDTELIHMDKGEIASLQQIAMAHGGSLTINPQTGLPEAGFLSAMLPMIAGAGLMMIPGMQAGAAGLIVGGLKTAQSGSLSKGIMAGLGAYGGAGLAGSAGAAGASSVTPTTITPPPAPVIPEGVANFGPNMSPDAFSAMPTTPVAPSVAPSVAAPTTVGSSGSAGMDQFIGGSGGAPAGTAPIPNPSAGISNAAPVSEQAYVRAIDNATIPKDFNAMNATERLSAMKSGASFGNAYDFAAANPKTAIGAGLSVAAGMKKDPVVTQPDKDMGQRYSFTGGKLEPTPAPDVPSYEDMLTKQGNFGRQRQYFNSPTYSPISKDEAKDLYHFAGGGPVEQMSNNSMMGVNTMYPMANISTSSYGTPDQMAEGGEAEEGNFLASIARAFGKGPKKQDENPGLKYAYDQDQGQYVQQQATGGLSDARYNLGGYSDGGRLLRGPGDGVSDSIPAVIGKKQPARLADGEFVVPARIVSELGNGSTEAGARKLYAMMDRIQAARKKTVGKDKVAQNSRSSKYLPA